MTLQTKTILGALLVLSVAGLFAASSSLSPKKVVPCNPERIYPIAEKMPRYKGGPAQLSEDLNAALSLDPEMDASHVVSFTVTCEGLLCDIVTFDYHSKNKTRVAGLKKALSQLPAWQPARQGPKLVDCEFRLIANIQEGKISIKH